MDEYTNPNSPPPYSANAAESLDLPEVQATVRRERARDDGNIEVIQRESRHLRDFIVFTLSIDYRRNISATLSGDDRQHFATMSSQLHDLGNLSLINELTGSERVALEPYLWLYLHEPCRWLAIPVHYAIVVITRFFKFMDGVGRYVGSAHCIMNNVDGPTTLASKLHMDETILIPRLVQDAKARSDLLEGLRSIEEMFFEDIAGVEGSNYGPNPVEYYHQQNISYILNRQGQEYEDRYAIVKSVVDRTGYLSLAYWAKRVKECMSRILLVRGKTPTPICEPQQPRRDRPARQSQSASVTDNNYLLASAIAAGVTM